MSNVGGARNGTNVLGLGDAQVTVGLRRLLGWRGAQLHVSVITTSGNVPSDRVGDVQGISNQQAPSAVRIEELWLEQNLLRNHLSVLAGRFDLNAEFYRLESAALFVNSSFGIGPEFAGSGVAGPSIFPNTSLGARLDVKPSAEVVWRSAVLDGRPVGRPEESPGFFSASDGLLLVSEVAVLSRPDGGPVRRSRRIKIGRGIRNPYGGKVAIGAWHYTATFPDLAAVDPGGAPVLRHGSSGAYLIADEQLTSDIADGAGPSPIWCRSIRISRCSRICSTSGTRAVRSARAAHSWSGWGLPCHGRRFARECSAQPLLHDARYHAANSRRSRSTLGASFRTM